MTLTASLKTILIAAVLGAGLVGAAEARNTTVTAQLSQPVAARTQVIADNAVWTCNGDTCIASVREADVRSCRQFVREAGPVLAFGATNASFGADELARCNANAPANQQARNGNNGR